MPSILELPDQIVSTPETESTSRDVFDNLEVLEKSESVSLSFEESPVGWRVSCMFALGSWILLGLAGYFRLGLPSVKCLLTYSSFSVCYQSFGMTNLTD